jgi:xanthine dehydrogenase YagT iron-sulfur-binding subunit
MHETNSDERARTAPAVAPLDILLTINGERVAIAIDPRVTLLDLVREHLQLTGTKKGCNYGECGACTIHLDGRRVNACMVLAAQANGRTVTTIEGLADGDTLHPVQQAFIDHDGFQCGFCTPGQVMSAVACIAEGHTGSDAEIREWMSGNLCRCSSYPQILDAVRAAATATATASATRRER